MTKAEYINYYLKNKLLTNGKSSTKLGKNTIKTYNLSLLPHSLNSKKENLCTFSTKECRAVCLNTSGRGIFTNVQEARERRTEFFVKYKYEFLSLLNLELSNINKKGERCLIRLNTFSDLDWANLLGLVGVNIENYTNLLFYHYSKNPAFVLSKRKNEEYTFSYSGYNWKTCEELLKNKICNVAMVFHEVPTTYKGFSVISGEESDMRLQEFDGIGNIIGLKYKRPKKTDVLPTKFVI